MSLSKSVIVTNVVLFLFLSTSVPTWGLTNEQRSEYQKEVDKTNKTLPKMLNKDIQLTKVSLKGSTLVCDIKSTLNDKKQIERSTLKKTAKLSAARNLCSRQESLRRMENGLTLKYVIYDKNGSYVYDYSITEKDCGRSPAPPDKSGTSSPKPQKQATPPANLAPQAQGSTSGTVKVH
jgi:hypothetical protein